VSDVVVAGGGGHARVLASILQRLGCSILGYTAPDDRGPLLGLPWLGDDGVLGTWDPAAVRLAIGVGMPHPGRTREDLVERLRRFALLTVVAPSAVVDPSVEIGEGSVVFDGAVVQAGTRIGRVAIVNTSSTVDHDCRVDDYAHIAPGATLCGGVTVGRGAMVGAGATILPGRLVGEGVVVGAGSVVTGDCASPGVYVGAPARRRR
jgi:sugar O-acyltransferase (sialic acid O-acetyltransferase NeuD family)